MFTVGGATLSDPELEPFCDEIMVWHIKQAGNSGVHLYLAVAEGEGFIQSLL